MPLSDDKKPKKPIVLACAGCSFAGHLAYDLASELDRRGIAEMSCLAGVAAEKPSFLRKIEGREVWLIDGCPIECGLGVFARIGKYIDRHVRLHDFGIKKERPPEEGVNMDVLIQTALAAIAEKKEAVPTGS